MLMRTNINQRDVVNKLQFSELIVTKSYIYSVIMQKNVTPANGTRVKYIQTEAQTWNNPDHPRT